MIPININNGTARRVKLVITPQICSGNRLKKSTPRKTLPNSSETAPNVNATGNPTNRRTNIDANIRNTQIVTTYYPVCKSGFLLNMKFPVIKEG
jgi:hypothetical protein